MAKINLAQVDLNFIANLLEPGKTANDLKTLHLEYDESYVEFLERGEDGGPRKVSSTPIFIEKFVN